VNWKPALLTLTLLAVTLLAGCKTTEFVPVVAPCPPRPEPPPVLMTPPESPRAMKQLDELLRKYSQPVSETLSG